SEVFAVAFELLVAGTVILTLNVLLLVFTPDFSLSQLVHASPIHGRSHNLLPEPKPCRLLSIPSGCRCLYQHVEGQCDFEVAVVCVT
ncbi:hypothetical protein ACH5RR_003826, partial [Cinchona calisaya]